MRVLFRIRSDIERFPGGDEVQLRRTREALEALGVETAVLPGVAEMPAGFDLVHLFNTTRIHETLAQFLQARARHVPVVVSTIWHSTEEMRKFYGHVRRWPWFPLTAYQSAKEAWYARRSGLPISWSSVLGFRAMQRSVVREADAVLPNSNAELALLRSELGASPRAAFVVPNGFTFAGRPAPGNIARQDILCVGRIEPRKNQLGVIRAFKRLPRGAHRLRLFGAMTEAHDGYAAQVRAELVPGWVEYAGVVSQTELAVEMARAAVVVLASFFETCGLVVLEALACGARACVTQSPCLQDYYGKRVDYCDPYDEASIAAGLTAALDRAPEDHTEFLRGFSWERAAEKTLRAYEQVLAARRERPAEKTSLLMEAY
ncbi:MAG: glycosyltransferase [Chthoniobacter sp.]|uniref:glycosyltransferase n=1 Tax=Chthoniobacter sp. TaxID=2510640 RepID=UPI0032A57FB1